MLNVVDALNDLSILPGIPSFIPSDYKIKFVAQAVQYWNKAVAAKIAYVEPRIPWKN
ncbi:hypothetical protein V8J82_21985 [Gymnodinialimonas sp. 2305UL16-5]|uniref:hypothetical protein n=1 Tax=Gymnodinialimonas mytili TaxID=3126503 RepID=UPI00309AF5BE